MWVDDIRRCYTTNVRFFKDSEIEIPIRWFFVDDDAKDIAIYTRFGSGNWASDKIDWPGPGEVLGAPRQWVDGSYPPFTGGRLPGFEGQFFKGPAEWFADGAPYPGRPVGNESDGGCVACQGFGVLSYLCDYLPFPTNYNWEMELVEVLNPMVPQLGVVGTKWFLGFNDPPNPQWACTPFTFPNATQTGPFTFQLKCQPFDPSLLMYFALNSRPIQSAGDWDKLNIVHQGPDGGIELEVFSETMARMMTGILHGEIWRLRIRTNLLP